MIHVFFSHKLFWPSFEWKLISVECGAQTTVSEDPGGTGRGYWKTETSNSKWRGCSVRLWHTTEDCSRRTGQISERVDASCCWCGSSDNGENGGKRNLNNYSFDRFKIKPCTTWNLHKFISCWVWTRNNWLNLNVVGFNEKLRTAEEEAKTAQNTLKGSEKAWSDQEERYKTEANKLQERVDDLQQQNRVRVL